MQPALRCPEIANITSPFLVRCRGPKTPIQKIGGNVVAVIAVYRVLEFMRSADANIVISHQLPDPAFANDGSLILEFISYSLANIGTIITYMFGANVDQIEYV